MNQFIRKKNIRPIDEAPLWLIAKRLKEMPECPHSKRVESILVLLLKLREKLGTVGVLPLLRQLNPLIRRYQWFNQLGVTSSEVRLGVLAVPEDLSEEDHWERGAVWALLELVKHPDGLCRIKRCGVCDAWVFAQGRKDQEFCGGVCRQKHYDSDPQRRAEHRAAMRRLYALKKELAQNPESGVGLERRKGRTHGAK
jgi:hypothetical protein